MRNLRSRQAKCAARLPFTDTFDTVIASDRSSANSANSVSVSAVMVTNPESRFIATLYSRSSS